MTEKLCLKWNDFQENVSSAFGSLREDNEFSDVTLACEDGQQVEAHKVILVASSPFFQSLLRRNKHPHPLIYMRGVKSEDLLAIIDFLYMGEANVYQENIDAFLAIAEELNLKGLTGNSSGENIEEAASDPHISNTKRAPKNENHLRNRPQVETYKNEAASAENKPDEDVAGTLAVTNYQFSGEMLELDEQVKSMMTKSENMLPNGRQKADICNVCGKEGKGNAIKDHIEANHLEGVSIPCKDCEKTFRTRNGLRKHVCGRKY